MPKIIKKVKKETQQVSVKKLICVCGLCDCGDSNNATILSCKNSGLMMAYAKNNQSSVDNPMPEN